MAKRIVHLLESVEIQHDDCAAALLDLVGGKRRGQALSHTMAVGKTGKRIESRHARCLALFLVGGCNIPYRAAITGKILSLVELRTPRQQPPFANAFVIPISIYEDGEFGKARPRAKQVGKGFHLVLICFLADGPQDFCNRLSDDRSVIGELGNSLVRKICQTALGIRGPEPCQVVCLNACKHLQSVPVGSDGNLGCCRFGVGHANGIGIIAAKPLPDTANAHELTFH